MYWQGHLGHWVCLGHFYYN
ncbi:unnamed protein product [Spirodela intermedia]|uniref:Uncharacterized protein n=1 Tax=Spirodela intermedia TaxID=51605 RepID=A0A7I8KMF6_SPIIN|nr:unnamed protein product [Spirodela intermedia]